MSFFELMRGFGLGIVLALAVGCAQPETQARAGAEAVHRETVVIETQNGPVRFEAEIADTDEERARGLMFRREMAPDHGMLFDFPRPEVASFWMRNTPLPLDIIFIGPDGRILNVAEHTTPFSDAPIRAVGPTRGVLEINAGLARAHGVAAGDRVRHRIFPND